jgi:predicted transcriptional regulator
MERFKGRSFKKKPVLRKGFSINNHLFDVAKTLEQPFNQHDLADAAGISGSDKSRPDQVACSYLSKWVKKGLIQKVERAYVLTKSGVDWISPDEPLFDLMIAAQKFIKDRGTDLESKSFNRLARTVKRVSKYFADL